MAVGFLQNYLIYSRIPNKPVDCIVLLYGPEFDLRCQKAVSVAQARLTDLIYFPLTNSVKTVGPEGIPLKSYGDTTINVPYSKLIEQERLNHLENTHLELLVAKSFVRNKEVHSIAIISSPYHMRRVKLMADRLFNPEVERYYLSPNNYSSNLGWIFNLSELKWIFKETFKIAWFLFYWHLLPAPELTS